MTQGSALTPAHSNPIANLTAARQRVLFRQVKEKAALCYGIEQITINCQVEGFVTLQQVEHIQHLAAQLTRQLEALANEIASI
jgi:hypothetical protein